MADEQRDKKEEMDNAMTYYRENGRQVMDAGWGPNEVYTYVGVNKDKMYVEPHSSSQELMVYTGLIQAPDGSLWEVEDA